MGETELVRVTDVTYEDDGELVVKMIGRTQDGRRVVKDIYETEPYFFIPEDAMPVEALEDDLQDKIVTTRSGFESYDGVRLIQVVTQYPSDVSDIRSEYPDSQRYETDLIYERRCTADYGLSGYVRVPKASSVDITDVEDVDAADVDEPIEPRICIADIEVEVPDVFSDDFSEEEVQFLQSLNVHQQGAETAEEKTEGEIKGGAPRQGQNGGGRERGTTNSTEDPTSQSDALSDRDVERIAQRLAEIQ